MATLWDIVTDNSSLPVQAGNTFWDHINNQQGGVGGGDVFVGTPLIATIDEKLAAVAGGTLSAELATETLIAEVVQNNEITICQ